MPTEPTNFGATAPHSASHAQGGGGKVAPGGANAIGHSGVMVGANAAPFGLLSEIASTDVGDSPVKEGDELYNPKMPAKFQRR